MGRVTDSDGKGKSGEVDEGEGFLPRWSRRKHDEHKTQLNTVAVPDSAAQGDASEEGIQAAASPARQELTDADMPPIDSLGEQSDYTAFMSPRVSDRLRAQALRKLFHLPAYNITDGLNDYDEDYTRFAGLGNIVTQEMKRMLKRETEEGETAGEVAEQETVMADVQIADTEKTNTTVTEDTVDSDDEKDGM